MESSRLAETKDLNAIVELARALADELIPTRGGELWSKREAPSGDLFSHYERLIAHVGNALFVGTIDEEIVGFASVQIEILADGSLLGVIQDIYVDPDARSVGVGESLANSCLAWCEDNQCGGVDARALPGNRAAKNFFEINGFVARSITMHRAIDPTA